MSDIYSFHLTACFFSGLSRGYLKASLSQEYLTCTDRAEQTVNHKGPRDYKTQNIFTDQQFAEILIAWVFFFFFFNFFGHFLSLIANPIIH